MRDQKRWMKNWIRALAVGTMITAAVPISVMAAEKGWVNEDGAAHYVDSNGSYVKNQWKTSQGVSYYLDENGDLAQNVENVAGRHEVRVADGKQNTHDDNDKNDTAKGPESRVLQDSFPSFCFTFHLTAISFVARFITLSSVASV